MSRKQLEEIDELYEQSETGKFLGTVRRMTNEYQPKSKGCIRKDEKIVGDDISVQERWMEHLTQLFIEDLSEDEQEKELEAQTTNDGEYVIDQTTLKEIKVTIGKIKKKKNPVLDNFFAELLKHEGGTVTGYLHDLICMVLINDIMAEEQNTEIICPIYEKRYKLDCINYTYCNVTNCLSIGEYGE